MTIPAWLRDALGVVRCSHHWIVKGDGDGILWLECLYCEARSVGWFVHPPRYRS
jgi:hypothetical protein